MNLIGLLKNFLKRRTTPAGWEWLNATLSSLSTSVKQTNLLTAYTAASRQLGRRVLDPSKEEIAALREQAGLLVFDRWCADDLGRAVFLLSLLGTARPAFEELAVACYESGDSSEQASWLLALSLLPNCDRFLAIAIDSCRTNIMPLFEAIACENPYPSLHFPDLNFNQMILKSLFNGISLSRIVGLESRFNEELSRMADDYVSEREAAGREVPVDIWLVIAPRVRGEGLARVHRYLEHENPQHRRWAALGLSHRKD